QNVLMWLRSIGSSHAVGNSLNIPFGQAFLLGVSEDGGARIFDPATLATLRIPPPSLPEGADENQAQTMRQAMAPSNWRRASLSQLAHPVERQLRQQSKQDRQFQNPFQSADAAKGLLIAAILHAKGETDKANAIAHLAFSLSPDRKTLLKSALNKITDGKYLGIVARFRQEGDWSAFQRELSTLIEERGESWQCSDAASEVLEKIANHTETADVLPGDEFSEAQRRAAANLLKGELDNLQGTAHAFAAWPLLPPNNLIHRTADDPLLQFLGMRREAIEVLLAWIDDDTLTSYIAVDRRSMHNMFSGMNMTESNDPAQAAALQQEAMNKAAAAMLPRPQPRSSIASALLEPALVLPNSHRQNAPLSPDLVREEAASLLDMNPLEMARYYLRDGSSQQQQAAMRYLAHKGTETDMATAEDLISNTTQPHETVQLLRSYVRARGENAAEFFDRITQTLLDDENSHDYVQRQIEELRPFVQPAQEKSADTEKSGSFEEALQEYTEAMAAGNQNSGGQQAATMAMQDFQKAMLQLDGMTERINAFNAILDAVLQAEDAKQKAVLTMQLFALPRLQQQMRGQQALHRQNNASAELLTWEKVLAEDGPAKSREQGIVGTDSGWDSSRALKAIREREEQWIEILQAGGSSAGLHPGQPDNATMVAYALFQMTEASNNQPMGAFRNMQNLQLLPDGGKSWILNAARRLVKGDIDSFPPAPGPGTVSEKDRQALLDRLVGADTADLPELLTELEPAEYLAVREEIPSVTDKKLLEALQALLFTIRETHLPTEATPLTKLCEEMSGKRLTSDSIRKLHEGFVTQAEKGTGGAIIIRLTLQGGNLHIADAGNSAFAMGIHSDMHPKVNGVVHTASGRHAFAFWAIQQDKSNEAEKDSDNNLDAVIQQEHRGMGSNSQSEEFWTTVEEIFDPDSTDSITEQGPIQISFNAILPTQDGDKANRDEP
ncbi:MAG: hypothetical protein ACOCUY_03410, partial [Verrucomicrobiota bacterium]